MSVRKVKKIIQGMNAVDGAGVKLVRVVGHNDVKDFDPFLMLDAFDSSDPKDYIKGFPHHPHRGIETVTYLISGKIEHEDSLKNKGVINGGDCQWMTAGSGIIHQEMPKPAERMLGCQLWVNLPAKDKMTDPKYRDITKEMVPVIKEDGNGSGTEIRVLAGEYKGTAGAMQADYVKINYLDVTIKPNTAWTLETNPENTLFIYILSGSANFKDQYQNPVSIFEKSAVLFDGGETFETTARTDGVRFLLFEGKPLKESIAWGGPIVMNTREELEFAFYELDRGTFVKHK
ncbi:hypothetical protein MsAg5_05090 [Methanosarcinaceae archaeon Ag5]|uniref:Pirin family protein n=1 Tax=Methanolapillus africanus TaxID=3028297 RepID=A0AAE4MIP8_9EURY|nr:hypothetical protein [Methanosarcinaceae archaeon Ag5]